MVKEIKAYKHYYADFIKKLNDQERRKIHKALALLRENEQIPYHYIKHIREGIHELRVSYGSNALRLFFIYDGDTIVILFNGFKKKTQKTPTKEINKALKLKKEYYESK